ncbi:MAG: hypothetical protein H0Z24_10190 [Thermosipho sp. (in: Bacteria)]|nr:hypothetical protein [Thermosipho sp. (in: thermotogales)]
MIVEAVLNLIKALLLVVIGALPSLDMIQLPVGFMDWFTSQVSAAAYFLPVSDFLIMFGIWVLVINFQTVWRIIQRVWDALPFT